jgi:hypothetical protein
VTFVRAPLSQLASSTVGAENRVLLAGELAQSVTRHAAFIERGEERVRADLALDVGQVAAPHLHQLSALG